MKVYQMELGYKQYIYLLRLEQTERGHNYLCIDIKEYGKSVSELGFRIVGDRECDVEEMYVSESSYKIESSPLYNPLTALVLSNSYEEKDLLKAYNDGVSDTISKGYGTFNPEKYK